MLLPMIAIGGGLWYMLSQDEESEEYGSVSRMLGGRGMTTAGVAGWMGGRVLTSPYATVEVSQVQTPHNYGPTMSAPGSRFGAAPMWPERQRISTWVHNDLKRFSLNPSQHVTQKIPGEGLNVNLYTFERDFARLEKMPLGVYLVGATVMIAHGSDAGISVQSVGARRITITVRPNQVTSRLGWVRANMQRALDSLVENHPTIQASSAESTTHITVTFTALQQNSFKQPVQQTAGAGFLGRLAIFLATIKQGVTLKDFSAEHIETALTQNPSYQTEISAAPSFGRAGRETVRG